MTELKDSSLCNTLIITQISDPEYASPQAQSFVPPFPAFQVPET